MFLHGAGQCILGRTVEVVGEDGALYEHVCAGAAPAIFVYLAVNLTYNVSLLLLIKRAGTVLFAISSTASLPVSLIVFFAVPLPFLGRADASHWLADLLGLFITLTGIVIYRVSSIIRKRAEAEKSKILTLAGAKGMEDVDDPIFGLNSDDEFGY